MAPPLARQHHNPAARHHGRAHRGPRVPVRVRSALIRDRDAGAVHRMDPRNLDYTPLIHQRYWTSTQAPGKGLADIFQQRDMERHLSRAHHGAYVRRQGGWHFLAGPLQHFQHVRVSLLAGRSRVRLSLFPAVTLLLGAYFLFVAAPADAQRIPTVSLNAPRVLDEGTSANVTVELTASLSHSVTIPVTVSRMVTARGTGRYTIGGLQNPDSISFTIAAGSRTSSPLVLTALADDNRTHQFITLALDTGQPAALGASGRPTLCANRGERQKSPTRR